MKIPHLVLIAALGAGSAQADINFISVAGDLSNISPTSSVVTVNNSSDNLWWQRNGFGETGETILEMWTAENAAITLTLDGLAAGKIYHVYVNYIRFGASVSDPDGNRGGARAALENGSYILFNGASVKMSGTKLSQSVVRL